MKGQGGSQVAIVGEAGRERGVGGGRLEAVPMGVEPVCSDVDGGHGCVIATCHGLRVCWKMTASTREGMKMGRNQSEVSSSSYRL